MRRAVALSLTLTLPALAVAADPPKVVELRANADHPGYFHVRFTAPNDVALPPWGTTNPTALARLPRFISDETEAVNLTTVAAADFARGPLEFVGVWPRHADPDRHGAFKDTADFRLVYPRASKAKGDDPFENCSWVEAPVVLKRADARHVRALGRADRKGKLDPDDLEGLFFAGLQARFAHLQRQAPDFGFYAFAQAALARQYGLPTPPEVEARTTGQAEYRRFYETLAGGSALTDSLAINRLLRTKQGAREERTIPVASIAGVTIREHDWRKMMGDRKPAAEPLARFAPADNYYARLRDLDELLELGELLDLWGNNLLHAFEYRTRDYRLRERYETQLCLPSARLAKLAGPRFSRGIAVTGSDPYLREGTDLTVIFHLTDPKELLKHHDAFIAEARRKYRAEWKEGKTDEGGTTVEHFTTPLREVSAYRAVVGEFVVVSNSRVGLKRALNAQRGKAASLADSLDFKYMRTCFRADDREEDGFAFLPDAFIRRLTGPADRIKQARRAEALSALHLATNAALLRGWCKGLIAEQHYQRWHGGFLDDEHLAVPDGKPVRWDLQKNLAVSDAYGTIHFSTPLIEQPIDRVTGPEKAGYEEFRRDYMRLWSQFFDPVGLRFRQDARAVKFETYILPLVQSQDYQWLRSMAADHMIKFDPSRLGPKTVLYFVTSFGMGGFIKIEPGALFLRVDDSPLLKDFVKILIENERAGRSFADLPPEAWQTFLRMPIVIGVEGDAAKSIKDLLPLIRQNLRLEDIDQEYRGVKINGRKLTGDDPITREVNPPGEKARFHPTFYYAEFGKGLYFAFRPEPLKEMIDQHKDGGNGKKPDGEEVNAALRVLPRLAEHARDALQMYFEWQTHRRALPSNAVWYALQRSRILPDGASDEQRRAAARHYLGYLPVSPDGSAYRYDPRADEVVNRRHGSWRQPTLWPSLAADAPLQTVLDRAEALQFQLRFREDGVHTTITWEKR